MKNILILCGKAASGKDTLKRYIVEALELSGIEFNIWEGHRLFIYDKDLNKAVKIITIRDDVIKVRDLDENDMEE